jgi:Ca-activated chloride channel family protein
MTYDDVIANARASKGDDPFGYRAEFIQLVRLAKTAAAMQP